MMSKVQRGLCLNSTGRTPKHPNISRPSTSLYFPSAPLPTSRTLRTQSPWIGLLADARRDVAPLRGGSMSGFVPCKVISSKPRSNLPSQTYVIRPIPRFDPHGCTRGCSSEQLYSSSDTVGAPQLDL